MLKIRTNVLNLRKKVEKKYDNMYIEKLFSKGGFL